jgi:hypothetical protein
MIKTILAVTATAVAVFGSASLASYVPTTDTKGYLTEISVGIDTTQETSSCYISPGDSVSLIGIEGLGVFALDGKGCASKL